MGEGAQALGPSSVVSLGALPGKEQPGLKPARAHGTPTLQAAA